MCFDHKRIVTNQCSLKGLSGCYMFENRRVAPYLCRIWVVVRAKSSRVVYLEIASLDDAWNRRSYSLSSRAFLLRLSPFPWRKTESSLPVSGWSSECVAGGGGGGGRGDSELSSHARAASKTSGSLEQDTQNGAQFYRSLQTLVGTSFFSGSVCVMSHVCEVENCVLE